MSFVNFQMKDTGSYADVERSIFKCIYKHLPAQSFSLEYQPRHDAVNMAMFFGRGGDVFMSHGVADKNYTYKLGAGGRFAINGFGAIMVPGPWLKEKLLRSKGVALDPDQILTVGWPRLDALLEAQRSHPRMPSEPLKVLWAPTHDARRHGKDQISTSSYPDFMPFTEKLAEHVDLSIGLHPRNRDDKAPTAISLLEADVVISDFGTMVYEAWALGKPVIFPYWIVGEGVKRYRPGSAEAHIFEKRLGYHPNSFGELLEMLQTPLSIGRDVQDFMDAYLPTETLGRSGEIIARHLSDISDNLDAFRRRSDFRFIQETRIASIDTVDENRRKERDLLRRLQNAEAEIKSLKKKLGPPVATPARTLLEKLTRRFR